MASRGMVVPLWWDLAIFDAADVLYKSRHVVIASAAKQSRVSPRSDSGLLRFARNDGWGGGASLSRRPPPRRGPGLQRGIGLRKQSPVLRAQFELLHRAA